MTSETTAIRRQQIREERSHQAIAAAVSVAREHGITVKEPAVLADLFSVMVHLRPSPVVARISTWTSKIRSPITDCLRREIDVTSYLSGRGGPVVSPSAELPPGPHVRDGYAISFWTYVQPDPDGSVSMADCSAMLVDLHAELRSYPGDLPTLLPATNDIPLALRVLDDANGVLKPAELERLVDAAQRLRSFAEQPPGQLQPLHGDVHPGNLIPTANGPIWIDFEDVCRGPVEWDLALMVMYGAADDVAARHRTDPAVLARCMELRTLHILLCLMFYRDDLGDTDGWDDGIRGLFTTFANSTPA